MPLKRLSVALQVTNTLLHTILKGMDGAIIPIIQ